MTTGAPGVRRLPVVAIDGPGGSGKSTVSRELARRLGWRYLDTGAMYRAVTVAVMDAGKELTDQGLVAAVATNAQVRISTDPDEAWVELDGRRVTERIRHRDVTNAVSAVSAVPAVRNALLVAQQQIVGVGAIVIEGRDIGTTVVPDAEVKIFLTADSVARAARRHQESAHGDAHDVTLTHAEMHRRDALDAGRDASPLAAAPDAVHIDTTEMSVEQVVAAIMAHCTFTVPTA